MKLAFSTLGCPEWELGRIAEVAHALGYEGIELRALGGDIDLLGRPELQPGTIAETRQWFIDQQLAICCVDSSCTFDSPEPDERCRQVDVALGHCELADALGAPFVRVFPDKLQAGASREETRDAIASCLRQVAERAPPSVKVALETHGDFARVEAAAEIIKLAAHPRIAMIWDVANALAAGDTIEESAQAALPYLAHVHLRDARPVARNEHWLPVLAGRGLVPFAAAINALNGLQYTGYISFEWEKYWHPEIEDPEVALPDFIAAVKSILKTVK